MRRRSVLAIAAAAALGLAGCTSTPTPEAGGSETEADSAGNDETSVSTADEIAAEIIFDGEPIDFEEVHCGPVAVEDNNMRFLGIYEGGEVVINDGGGVDGTAVITVIVDGEPDYSNSAGPELIFDGNEVHGTLEISNSEDTKAEVSVDVVC